MVVVRARAALAGHRWQLLSVVVTGLLLSGIAHAASQVAPRHDDRIKAEFLSNLTEFVNWPSAAYADIDAPLVIGVLGDDSIGSYLDDAVRGKHVRSRRLTVQRFRRLEDVRACQLLFVSRSEGKNLESTLSTLKRTDILTVSDADGFAARGGMIQLASDRGRIRLKINVDAARAAGLVISSKVLRSAEIVATRVD
jgi:hypothetical protein